MPVQDRASNFSDIPYLHFSCYLKVSISSILCGGVRGESGADHESKDFDNSYINESLHKL